MKFLLDQSADARLIEFLIQEGHDAARIGSDYPGGISDREVLAIANREQRILITDDRDFGELIIRHQLPHQGVIYLRLGAYASLATKVERISNALDRYADAIATGEYLVVTLQRVRVRTAG